MNDRHRLLRLRAAAIAVFAAAALVAGMLATHRSAHPVLGSLSVPAALALLLAVASCGATLTAAVLPSAKLRQFQSWLRAGLHPFEGAMPRGNWLHAAVLLVLAAASYLTVATRLAAANDRPIDDQWDYLRVAAEIRADGGAVSLIPRLVAGKFTESNRNPLYPALLSWCDTFESAKRLSIGLGLATLAAFALAALRRFGWLAGGVAVVLLATNGSFTQSASIVACEMPLIALAAAVWFVATNDAEGPQCRPHLPEPQPHWRGSAIESAIIGAVVGLAYLTKASAFFLLVGWLAWSFFQRRLRRWSWLALVAFAVVASPLLVRNARVFGDPLHSFNTRFLFADSFDEGLNREFRGTWVEARDYVKTHSARSIARRAATGLGWECYILLRSLGPASFGASRPLVGLIVLLLAALGIIGADARSVWLAAIWTALFVLFFAWYVPIAAGDRFLAPLVPVLLTFAARGAVRLLALGPTESAPQFGSRRVLLAAALWCAAIVLLNLAHRPGITG